jgi:hypothetical protein
MKQFIDKTVKKIKVYSAIAVAKLIPILKGIVPFLKELSEKLREIVILSIRYNQYDSQGEIIDVIVRKFEVRKFYKRTPKHMVFKQMNGKKVEVKTDKPMDYVLEDI